MNATATLARFAASLRIDDVPKSVQHAAKRLILDQLACQIGLARLPWSMAVYEVVRQRARVGPARVVVHADQVAAEDAAFVNSAFGHGNELDDAHIGVRTHPGAVIVPAAIAVAEEEGRGGRDLLRAVIAGYEVMLRVAAAGMPDLMEYRHHHTPPAVGPFGAAAAAAILLRLSADQIQHALAIAGSQSAGLMEYTHGGGSVKRIHCAIPSQAGIRSARFAQAGMTGPAQVLEGERGFLSAFAGGGHPERLVDQLGTRYLTPEVALKRYAANYRIHAPVDALLHLLGHHGIKLVDIAAIRVGVSSATLRSVGTISEPKDATGAQFSLRFALAFAAAHGPSALARLDLADLNDADVHRLAERVELYVDEECEAQVWSSLGAVVKVRTTSGEAFECRLARPAGSPENPLSDSDLGDKFLTLATPVIGQRKATALLQSIWALEDAESVRQVTELAVADG